MYWRLLLIILNFSCFVACSGNSLHSDGGDLTRSEVEWIAKNLSDAIEKKYPVLKHKTVNRYVDGLGQYIVSHNEGMPPLPYEFRVLKSNDVHVFSLPGGVVYVTLGTLRICDIEGQLAAFIAHELAHQQLGHALLSWRKKVNASRNQKFVINFDEDWETLFLGKQGLLAYEDGMEKEADQLATVILYRAKYDPRVMLSYLGELKKLERNDLESVSAMLSVHPKTEDRVGWAKEQLLQLPPLKDPKLTTASFTEIKAILKSAEGKKAKKRGMAHGSATNY